jgi:hypothetical protein
VVEVSRNGRQVHYCAYILSGLAQGFVEGLFLYSPNAMNVANDALRFSDVHYLIQQSDSNLAHCDYGSRQIPASFVNQLRP